MSPFKIFKHNKLQLNTYKMNIKTNLLEEYVSFVDKTKKQNKFLKIFLFLIVFVIIFLFLIYIFTK